jgi:hypothetical protein
MKTHRFARFSITALVVAIGILVLPATVHAHCDSMDGPVVLAAQEALETGRLEKVLIWVLAEDEEEIRDAFAHTVRVRALGGEAAELADRYFLETVVRVHRQGEGEPYTGLKPAGHGVGPAVTAADRSLAAASPAELNGVLLQALEARLNHYFNAAQEKYAFDAGDVDAGREFVSAYVRLLHLTEQLEAIAFGTDHGHSPAPPKGHDH